MMREDERSLARDGSKEDLGSAHATPLPKEAATPPRGRTPESSGGAEEPRTRVTSGPSTPLRSGEEAGPPATYGATAAAPLPPAAGEVEVPSPIKSKPRPPPLEPVRGTTPPPAGAVAVPVSSSSVVAARDEEEAAPSQEAPAADAKPDDDDDDEDIDEGEEPSVLPFVYLPESAVILPIKYQCWAFILFFHVVMFSLCMCLTITTWRYPDPRSAKQLPDIALDVLPAWQQLEHVTDLMLGSIVGMCFVIVFSLHYIGNGKMKPRDKKTYREYANPPETMGMVAWIRFFMVWAAASLLRIVVLAGTVLPATNNHCRTRPSTGNFWWNSFIGVATWGGSNVHCGDLLFSGHTSVITNGLCAVFTYGNMVHRRFRPVAVVLAACAVFTMLASRSHYTDDILVSFIFGVSLWRFNPHDGVRGASPKWQLFIQNPIRTVRSIVTHTKARSARREAKQAARAARRGNATSSAPPQVVYA